MSEPIAKHGGEILKFIGDACSRFFPLSQPQACANLLHAVTEARQAMVALNDKNSETGRAPLNYGIGVHVGGRHVRQYRVAHPARLHRHRSRGQHGFASRNPHQAIGQNGAIVRAFADLVKNDFDLERVGEYPVRGFNDPIELLRITAEGRSIGKRRAGPSTSPRTRQGNRI